MSYIENHPQYDEDYDLYMCDYDNEQKLNRMLDEREEAKAINRENRALD